MYPRIIVYQAKLHQWEMQREAEKQRLARLYAPHRNVALLALNKLGSLFGGQRSRTKQEKRVALSPKPVTGSL